MSEEELTALLNTLGCQQGDVVLIVADKDRVVLPTLGQLRPTLGKQLELIRKENTTSCGLLSSVLRVGTRRPELAGSAPSIHHAAGGVSAIHRQRPGSVRAQAYDMVVNGVELLSGSIRITDYELQQKMFEALGLTEEEIQLKFGFLVDAYKYGAPPRTAAQHWVWTVSSTMCGCDNLRDVVAFPKVQNASELMSQCPSPVDQKSLTIWQLPSPSWKEE